MARARARSSGSTSRRTTTRTTTISRGGGALRYVLPAAVVAGLAWFLWPKLVGATPKQVPPPAPNPNLPPAPAPTPGQPPRPAPAPAPAAGTVPVNDPPAGTVAYRYTVATNNVALRAAPAKIAAPVAQLNTGDTVLALDRNDARTDPGNSKVYYIGVVRPNGQRGWVAPADADGNALLRDPVAVSGASGQALTFASNFTG